MEKGEDNSDDVVVVEGEDGGDGSDGKQTPVPLTFFQRIRNAYIPLRDREVETEDERRKRMLADPFLVGLQKYTTLTPPQVEAAIAKTSVATTVAFIFGGVRSISKAAEQYQLENKTTKYYSHRHMQSELNTHVLRNFFVKGSSFGWRAGLFIAGVTLGGAVIENYRGQRDAFNLIGSGTAIGSLFGISKGLPGMAKGLWYGFAISSVFGLLAQTEYWLEDYKNKLVEKDGSQHQTQIPSEPGEPGEPEEKGGEAQQLTSKKPS